jgi:Uma2 family endonuclease
LPKGRFGVMDLRSDMQQTIGAAVRPLSVADFHAMAEAGIFADNERVELIDGMLVAMPPIGPAHNAGQMFPFTYLARRLGDAVAFSGPAGLAAGPATELQPDILLLKPHVLTGPPRYWEPSDIIAVIEVSDTSLAYDAGGKAVAYARGGFEELLVIDVKGKRILRYRKPGPDGYANIQVLETTDTFSLDCLPAIDLEVRRFFA